MPSPAPTSSVISLLLVVVPGILSAQGWRRNLDHVLDAPPLDRHLWGIAVADSSGTIVYGRNERRLFIPASNTKLVVTAATAVLLPPDFRVTTSLYGTGPIENGVLLGHLVLYGRGDPTWSRRCYAVDTTAEGACSRDPLDPLRTMARTLRQRGVRQVAGDIVGDGSWFEPQMIHPSWETGDVAWWYAAPVSGLGLNDNCLDLTAAPTTEGAPAALTVWPELPGIVLENRTRTVAAGTPRRLDVARDPSTGRLVVTGDIPLGLAPRVEYVAVEDPNRFAASALRQILAEEGVAVLGATESTTDSLRYREARRGDALASVQSRPVRDWMFPVLSTSQNWFAEMLLKQLGRQVSGEGSWAAGLEVERRFLIDSVGVDSTQFSLRDGSGLSAVNLVTPAAFVRLLAWMRHHPRWPEFSAGLPRGGVHGSLRTRFRGTPLQGRVLAKTGTLTAGNTLSGYLERLDGRLLIFSVQANHHALGSRSMVAAIDSVIATIAR